MEREILISGKAATSSPPSFGVIASGTIAKTLSEATTDEGVTPEVGSPQYKDKGAPESVEPHSTQVNPEILRRSDDVANATDDQRSVAELVKQNQLLEAEVCRLNELLTKMSKDKSPSSQLPHRWHLLILKVTQTLTPLLHNLTSLQPLLQALILWVLAPQRH